jgi:hypothetical protein
MRLAKTGIGWLIIFFIGTLGVSCANPTVVPLYESPTPERITQSPLVEALPTAVPSTPTLEVIQPEPLQPALPSYSIDAVYDAAQKKVNVTQLITLTHTSTKPIREITLIAEPNRYTNGFVLSQLENQATGQELDWELQGNRLKIGLADPLTDQQSLTILAEYTLQLPEIPPPSDTSKPQIFGYTQRQTNLVDWYLWLPPYEDEAGWVIHPPSFFGEYTVYPMADFEVHFEVINSPRQVIVAATSSPVEQTQNEWKYRLDSARNFALSVSADFQVAETEVEGVKISSYYFPLYKRQGEAVLQHTVQAYQLYSELFGELPRSSISAVQADFMDGMEFDGLFFLSKGFYDLYDGTDRGYLTLITVHETAHQWWYTVVANDQAQHPWLDEALCTYAERLYYERFLPESVEWWWYYRVNFYQPTGVIDLPVYDYKGYLAYRDAVYLRGALFLEELRKELGDEPFFAGLKNYYAENMGKIAVPQDFFGAFDLTEQVVLEKWGSYFGRQQ